MLRGRYGIDRKLTAVGETNCAISEITVAELLFGAEKSPDVKKKRQLIESAISNLEIIPIASSLNIFAREKARLSKAGMIISDFDLLIGATAIANDLILVTNNVKHFERLEGIRIENWISNS